MANASFSDFVKSDLGFGCMGITAFYGAPMEDEKAMELLQSAYDAGYRHFDTAEIYQATVGDNKLYNETVVGKFLQTQKRDTFTVATKYPPFMYGNKCDLETMTKVVDASLERLGLDYIDIYYCHRMPGGLDNLKEWMASLAQLVKAGKVKQIGLSEVNSEWLEEANKIHPVFCVQQEWSLLTREPIESNLVPTCAKLGVGVVAYSPLARNLLASEQKEAPKDWRATNPRFSGDNFEKNQALQQKIAKLAEAKKCTTAQLSLAWLYNKAKKLGVGFIAIPGTTKVTNAQANIGSLGITISDEDMTALEELAAAVAGARGDEGYIKMAVEGQIAK